MTLFLFLPAAKLLRHRVAVLLLVTLCLGAGHADASEPWSEPGYGVTLALPEAGTLLRPPPPGSLAAWRLADGALLRVRLLESEAAVAGLKQTQAAGWADFTLGVRTSTWLEERRIAGRPGFVQVLELVSEDSQFLPPWVRPGVTTYGQAMMKLDPYHLAVVEFFAEGAAAEATKLRIGAIADAVSVLEPPAMMARRRADVARAASFLAGLDRGVALRSLPARLVYDATSAAAGVDRLGSATRVVLAEPLEAATLDFALSESGVAAGWSVGVRDADGSARALVDEAWVALDDQSEAWSRKDAEGLVGAAPRDGLPGDLAAGAVRLRRTGIRNGDGIDVIVSMPSLLEDLPKQWTIPERLPPALIDGADIDVSPRDAYLNRLDVLLLPELLPRGVDADYTFYALDPDGLTLSLRLYRVEPLPDGGAEVTERPTPSAPPVVHRIDAAGRRVEIVQPTGLTFRLRE